MFGQTGNTSFGGFGAGTQSSPFGQSPFSKPITTTSFGGTAAPVFGSSNNSLFGTKPTGSTSGGLFGSTATTPAFGQPATSQSSFGGFNSPNANTGLFGGQQNANTSLFGATNPAPAFGQPTKPAGFGFGNTTGTGLFGQTQQPAQQTTPSLFGASNTTTNTSLFGTANAFAGTNTAGAMTGTMVKFSPLTGSDTMIKNGVTQTISTRHYCITCMKEYEGKSLEELRLEDYTAGRKGQAQGAQTTGLFGSPAQPSLFGNPGVNTSTANTGFGSATAGFGATSQPAATSGLFGAGKPMTAFGAAATTNSTFPFQSTTTTSNPFGANTQAKPFGAAAPTPLFGATNTTQTPATGFGPNNTTTFGAFGNPQPNQTIGLFNQPKSAFNMPASSASTGFGGFGQNTATNTTGGLFGAKPAGTTSFGGAPPFGATPAPTFGANTAFGASQNTGTSLFNSSFKPVGQTGFSFGATPSTSTGLGVNTGLNLGTGSMLFGQSKPGGLFSNPAPNPSFNSGGGFGLGTNFGSNNNAIGTGLGTIAGGVGTNPTSQNSGSMQVHQQILALVSAPFGDSPLLKNLLPASGKTEDLLKPTNATARSLNSPQYKIATNNSSPKVKARAVTNAQLSKKSLFEGLEEEDPILQEAFQPRANAKRLVLRPKSITVTDVQSLDRVVNSVGIKDSQTLEKPITESANKENLHQDDVPRPADDRRSSTSWLKSTLSRKNKSPVDEFEGHQMLFGASDTLEEGADNTVAELRTQKKPQNVSQTAPLLSAGDNALNSSSNIDKSILNSSHSSDTSHEHDETPTMASQIEQEPNAACVTLHRTGYYTIPPMDKLEEYVRGQTCIVPNFTVGRKGYGNVYFPDPFDIYGLNLDKIVHFRNKEVIIYPDDEQKPPQGEGLNRRAQVTLDRVWPHDKTLHQPITDPHRLAAMDYEGKLRRVSAKHDTKFLEYRPETGSWVFKVDHFSKYGLSDSDDDDDIPPNSDLKKLKATGKAELRLIGAIKKPHPEKQSSDPKQQIGLVGVTNGVGDNQDTSLNFQSEILDETRMTLDDLYSNHHEKDKSMGLSPSAIFARVTGTDSHKLQLMKASFFDTDDEDIDDGTYKEQTNLLVKSSTRIIPSTESIEAMEDDQTVPSGQIPMLRSNLSVHQDISFLAKESGIMKEKKPTEVSKVNTIRPSGLTRAFPPLIVRPDTVVLQFSSEVLPLKESIVGKLKARCIADTGIQMGRSFRVGWGPGLSLISLSTQKQAAVVPLHGKFSQLGSYVAGRLLDDNTSSIVQRLQIVGGRGGDSDNIQMFQESIIGHLRIQLDHCILGQEGDCPAVGAGVGPATLHAHCSLAQELADLRNPDPLAIYASHVWNLCVALWGNLPDIQSETEIKHHNVMVRREALSEWLENVLTETLTKEISEEEPSDNRILLLLAAHKLEEACKIAREVGDHCLALLMAQLGGAPSVRELIKQQLAVWQYTEVDADLSPDKLKLFMLIAGEPIISLKHGFINACEALEWKQALGLHLWYVCPPTASVTDAVNLYESAFNGPEAEAYASPPTPVYQEEDYETEISSGRKIQDLCFHLLKLYCTGNHPLEQLLNPLTHTVDPLDYRLSWLIQQVLMALGYSHLSAHVAALTHVNFAAQLETYGLWHWAIFVILHLEDTGRRRSAIIDLLSRNVQLDETTEYIKQEEFLREELGIPSMWINKAKATKARAMKRYGEAAWYHIQGEQWNMAHELIIDHLAADAIINENLEYLKSLLSPLVPTEAHSTINGWAHRGQLLWDYMLITAEVEALLAGNSDSTNIGYKLELLQPQLSLLCAKINQFPCPTAKHRLCQAEIAKRTAHLARSLVLLQSNGKGSTSKILTHLVTQLPLPEDYAQQELHHIVNMCVNELGSHRII